MTNFKTLAALMMTALMAAGTVSAADGKFGADRHAAMGLTCETCHGPDNDFNLRVLAEGEELCETLLDDCFTKRTTDIQEAVYFRNRKAKD